jgi:hypothetical protein
MNPLRTCGIALLASCSLLMTHGAEAQTIKADHTTLDTTVIPRASLDAARALSMSLSHASVGGNIWGGLTALSANNSYAFPNWTDNDRGNPGWQAKVTDFAAWVTAHEAEFDVFQNKFCFIDQEADFVTYRDSMLAIEGAHPSKTIVWWTIPLETTGPNNALRSTFNEQVRAYCQANDKPLFDLADIESHTEAGTEVSESGNEALDPAQSSDGGHLNELGAARAAAAQWSLMAQIAGWDNGGASGGSSGGTSGAGGQASAGAPGGEQSSGDDSGCSVTGQGRHSGLSLVGGVLLGLALVLSRHSARNCRRAA